MKKNRKAKTNRERWENQHKMEYKEKRGRKKKESKNWLKIPKKGQKLQTKTGKNCKKSRKI